MKTIIEDTRKIIAIGKGLFRCRVGVDGITKIIAYHETGQMQYIVWFAIYEGKFLRYRIDSSGMSIEYDVSENE